MNLKIIVPNKLSKEYILYGSVSKIFSKMQTTVTENRFPVALRVSGRRLRVKDYKEGQCVHFLNFGDGFIVIYTTFT